MKSPRESAQGLLQKAGNDLIAAEATIATAQALDMVCFHAHQAVEKSLKALLASRDVVYPWTHDLGELLALAKPLFPDVSRYENTILPLTVYAVEMRYDETLTPDIEEARQALGVAREVFNFTVTLIRKG